MTEDRDLVVQRLSEQFAADRISLEELERRLELVYQARSPSELMAITADLPAPVTLPAAHFGRGEQVQTIRTALGNLTRGGPMVLPPRLEVRTVLGNIELDLSEATFGPVTEIAVRSVLGNIEILLPAGVRVENDGDGVLGSFECRVPPGAMPTVGTAPIVRLTGRCILGNVEVGSAPPGPPPGSPTASTRR